MWADFFKSLERFIFWFVFFLVGCFFYAFWALALGYASAVPLWLLPFSAMGLVWSLAAGTIPVLITGMSRFWNWLYNLIEYIF